MGGDSPRYDRVEEPARFEDAIAFAGVTVLEFVVVGNVWWRR